VGRLVKSGAAPFAPYRLRYATLMGTSASSGTVRNYFPAHAAWRLPGGGPIFDGFLLTSTNGNEPLPIVDVPMELIRRAFEINVFAHLDLARRVVPQMMKRKRGRIVWTSSQAGIYAPPFLGAYAATKHAIEAIASNMRAELNLFGIGVATINPGLYKTGFNETGAESYQQWSANADVLVPMPPADPVMLLQHDPQPMIDAMIDVIPDKGSAYRTMLPEDAVVESKLAQELAWTNKSLGAP
jgi:NAD(P)-dependent dehydrogenase (short-subunit alcohol dehydrogenase family)